MNEDEQLVIDLGIGSLSPERQRDALDEFHMLVGEALSKDLSDSQLAEHRAINDGNGALIDSWLAENVPDYRDMIAYQAMRDAYDADPGGVSPERMFASLAWVQLNAPNLSQTVEEIKAQLKAKFANE